MKTKISAAIIGLFLLAACGSDQPKEGDQAATAEAPKSSMFVIKASNMMYLTLAPDSSVVASEPDPTKATVFEKVDMGEGKCALKASNGKFVIDNRNKSNQLFANSDHNWGWETFEIVAIDQSTINIKSEAGKYVGADFGLGNIICANRDKASSWETFTIEVK